MSSRVCTKTPQPAVVSLADSDSVWVSYLLGTGYRKYLYRHGRGTEQGSLLAHIMQRIVDLLHHELIVCFMLSALGIRPNYIRGQETHYKRARMPQKYPRCELLLK